MPDINISDTIIAGIVKDLDQLGLWIQTIGLIIIIWIIFQVITLINNRIKRKKLYVIEDRLKAIEGKVDKLLKNKER